MYAKEIFIPKNIAIGQILWPKIKCPPRKSGAAKAHFSLKLYLTLFLWYISVDIGYSSWRREVQTKRINEKVGENPIAF